MNSQIKIPENLAWVEDEYKCWNLIIPYENPEYGIQIHVWIAPRPSYCDRGHWVACVNGIPYIDDQDAFPRYYMDIERAKAEMKDWLYWRLKNEAKN